MAPEAECLSVTEAEGVAGEETSSTDCRTAEKTLPEASVSSGPSVDGSLGRGGRVEGCLGGGGRVEGCLGGGERVEGCFCDSETVSMGDTTGASLGCPTASPAGSREGGFVAGCGNSSGSFAARAVFGWPCPETRAVFRWPCPETRAVFGWPCPKTGEASSSHGFCSGLGLGKSGLAAGELASS